MVTAKTAAVLWPRGQAVKTSPFHGGNTGSIPVGVIVSPCKSGETLLTAAIWIARKRPKDGRQVLILKAQ